MIPRKLRLQGFMCYLNETEISFRGSSLWALCGPNGAGKSTLFDAMVFALFGEHRMGKGENRTGKQEAHRLIHHKANRLVVEFDFIIGDNEYRVRRTLLRRTYNNHTFQAFHLSGPDAPDSGRTGPQPVPGTDTRDGFKDWIKDTIGLDSRTFTASVLLQQGKSDALLRSTLGQRHQMLAQIIDLTPYEQLRARAFEHQRDHTALAKLHTENLSAIEIVDEETIVVLEKQVATEREIKEKALQCQIALAKLQPQATRWHTLCADQRKQEAALAGYTALLEQADQIEQQATRLHILQLVVPLLQHIFDKQGEQDRLLDTINQLSKQREEQHILQSEAEHQKSEIAGRLKTLRMQREETQEEQTRMQGCLQALAPMIRDIDNLQEQKKKLISLKQHIASFSPELATQQEQIQEALRQLDSMATALPLLQQFAKARAAWQQHVQYLDEFAHTRTEQAAALQVAAKLVQDLTSKIEDVKGQISTIQQEVASRKTIWEERQERWERFQSIDGQATCSYCGQPLAAEHLATERQRVISECREAEKVYQTAHEQLQKQRQQQKHLEGLLQEARKKEKQSQEDLERIQEQYNTATNKRDQAAVRTETALKTLAPEYSLLIGGSDKAFDLLTCLRATYPTVQDLQALEAHLQQKDLLTQQLEEVQNKLKQHNKLCSERDYVSREIQPLEQDYPPERIQALQQKHQDTRQASKQMEARLASLKREIEQKEPELRQIEKIVQKTEEKLNQIKQDIAVAQTKLEHVKDTIMEKQAELPADWQPHVKPLSETALASWQQEQKTLQDAEQRWQDLQAARRERQYCQQELEKICQEQAAIPAGAQRPLDELEQEMEQANQRYQAHEQREQELSKQVSSIKQQQERRQELEGQRKQEAHLAARYKELEHLLGPKCLQHYLVQKAEEGIISYANEALDCISGGMLYLELVPGSEQGTDALDLVAYNREISHTDTQPVDLLSGSQQFRVAVSLALGIGRYVGNENHHVESVIIDEGFGSLDEQGLKEMKQVILDLKDALKCIIVVSHQDEFVGEFENKYKVELTDGSSKVTLV